MQLLEIKEFDLVNNSSPIADGVEKTHKPIIQLASNISLTWKSLEGKNLQCDPLKPRGYSAARNSSTKWTTNHFTYCLHAQQRYSQSLQKAVGIQILSYKISSGQQEDGPYHREA